MTSPFDPGQAIRVLREPTVYLLGRQTVDDRGLREHRWIANVR